jgi:hypothetical protein
MRTLNLNVMAALMVAGMGKIPLREYREPSDYGTVRRPKQSIKHNGPVIDTTKEGKRAKRRRIAQGGK